MSCVILSDSIESYGLCFLIYELHREKWSFLALRFSNFSFGTFCYSWNYQLRPVLSSQTVKVTDKISYRNNHYDDTMGDVLGAEDGKVNIFLGDYKDKLDTLVFITLTPGKQLLYRGFFLFSKLSFLWAALQHHLSPSLPSPGL